ncbi:MAG: helix-turn-helix domain-containing protein, partial [Pseudomonadota bacterium]
MNTVKIRRKPRRDYHHGALRPALLSAAVQVLEERGIDRFSLRETARRAGVSPAAPAHHFGDSPGLLTAIATASFVALAEKIEAADAAAGASRAARVRAQCFAYVTYALENR